MTLPSVRAQAARIITDHGARDDQAESILRAFTAAGLNIIRRPEQVEPQTGKRAEKPHERVEELRRIVASVTKPQEEA